MDCSNWYPQPDPFGGSKPDTSLDDFWADQGVDLRRFNATAQDASRLLELWYAVGYRSTAQEVVAASGSRRGIVIGGERTYCRSFLIDNEALLAEIIAKDVPEQTVPEFLEVGIVDHAKYVKHRHKSRQLEP